MNPQDDVLAYDEMLAVLEDLEKQVKFAVFLLDKPRRADKRDLVVEGRREIAALRQARTELERMRQRIAELE